MTPRERYLAMLRGDAVDFVPRVPIVMRFAAEHIGSNYGRFAADYRVLVEANLRCAADFGFEQVSCISDPYRETHGFGGRIEYVPDSVPRCTAPLAATKDLRVLARPDPLVSERMRDRIMAVRAYRAVQPQLYSILGWIEGPAAEAADLRGPQQFLIDLLRDAPFAAELMDRCVEVGIEFARAQLAAGADTIGIGDAIASQVSPRAYEAVILPRQQRLIAGIKVAEARVLDGTVRVTPERDRAVATGGERDRALAPPLIRLHICGDITHLLPGIATLPIDILDVDHMVDMAAARRAFGPRVALAGNIDPVTEVRFGSPERIRRIITETYARVGNPYLVAAGCEIPSGTPAANLRALCAELPVGRSQGQWCSG